MAAVATEILNGHAIKPDRVVQRGRTNSYRVITPIQSRDVSPLPRNADFPRSASYTYLPEAKHGLPYSANPAIVTIKGSFSEADLITPTDRLGDISPPDSPGWATPDESEPKQSPGEDGPDLALELHKSPKISVQRMTPLPDDDQSSIKSSVRPSRASSIANSSLESNRTGSTQPTTPGSITPKQRPSFARRVYRKSWYSSSTSQPSTPSRSPSPPKPETEANGGQNADLTKTTPTVAPPPRAVAPRRKSLIRRKDPSKLTDTTYLDDVGKETQAKRHPERPTSRRSSLLHRKTSRPMSGMFSSRGSSKENVASTLATNVVPAVPQVPSLPKSFSTDKLPTYRSETPLPGRAAPMPRLVSAERVPTTGLAIPIRKRDELWSVFRGLDGDFTKFASKSVAFKANVVRSSLLPFLRTYAAHPSNKNLRPEDLDRRANILNKWWTGLIEMLHGRNNQSISGTDRPAILDGISGIMERPEWRLAPSPFCPLKQRLKGTVTPRNRSTTSLSSGTSEFLTESVHHNVRNIFIQNLSAQMAFVVDKMSLRNASASLVTFCGKACAYAFMFVPGMADVLSRLWDLQMDTLRRVLDGNGIGKFEDVSHVTMAVVPNFPPALQQLGFSSLMKYMRKLRTPPPLPLGMANIEWWGHWLERWSGRESDLFYVFVKHFHILANDFLPADASKRERMCAPGVLLVHAQILINLDATIHRDTGRSHRDGPPHPSLDDVLAGPDAVASALPLPPLNAIRIMAENRLVMLIRDFLSERTADHPIARQFFAESFNDLLHTTAKGTSLFDHAACYTLLDFLEEVLVILSRYEQISGKAIIDSHFWQSVCKKMISSHNTLTEIRLYAFLYTVWNTVVCDLGRKANLCLGLLLDAEIFESTFNHWCPMVRAYFMRLLCWRVARYDGEMHEGDVLILETLVRRLHTTWSYYLFLRDEAVKRRTLPPATNPCNPAPGRRMLIIRTDSQVVPGNSFLSFDGIVAPLPPSQPQLPSKRFSTLSHVVELDSRPETSRSTAEPEVTETKEKGISGLLRKVLGTPKKRSRSQSPAQRKAAIQQPPTNSDSASINASLVRSATEDSQAPRSNRGSLLVEPSVPATTRAFSASSTSTPPATAHRNFCFKFSLEYHPSTKHVPGPVRLSPPRLPSPAQKLLQDQSNTVAFAALHTSAQEPVGASRNHARYCGRALAEWALVVAECQSFFERRRSEGVPKDKFVETPALGVEVFKRPS